MKYLKQYENMKSIPAMINIANEYHKILEQLKPIVFRRCNEIAKDFDLSQNIVDVYGGDNHYIIHDINNVKLTEMKTHDNKIFFTINHYDYDDDEIPNIFYVPFTEEELKYAMVKNDVDKYNL